MLYRTTLSAPVYSPPLVVRVALFPSLYPSVLLDFLALSATRVIGSGA